MACLIWTVCFASAMGFFAWQVWARFRILILARRDDGRDYGIRTWVVRLRNTVVYAFGQKKFFVGEQPAGLMHIVIFWGFLVLALQVVTMFGRGWAPHFRIPGLSINCLGGIYALLRDLFEVAVLVGIGIALYRWTVSRPTRLYGFLPAEQRLKGQSHWEAFLILIFIAGIMISGLFYDAARMVALDSLEEIRREKGWQPVSRMLSHFFVGHQTDGRVAQAMLAQEVCWWVHNIIILIFLNLLPRSKHFHIITAIPNVFMGMVEPRGWFPKKDYSGDTPLFGRSQLPHFTWKQVLDMYSCTECGRCSAVCPATATHKPLAPRQFLLDLRDSLYSQQAQWLRKKSEARFDVVVGDGKPVIDEVVWSCVECRACEEACPVNIEYVDKIVDIRQHFVQEASRFPTEMSRAFKGMETQSNPWGISAFERNAWAEGLEVPHISEKPDAEYLYYVGCGGSFDANNKKVTQAFVKILKKAGVSFAILGKEELCNGESARRLGNEYLYQTMAEALARLLKRHKVKKIIVNCPHCFNTLQNEYKDFGGDWTVFRAADLVQRLVADGRVRLHGEFAKRIVYHDSCNYGRYNGIYDEQRAVLTAVPGTSLEEIRESRAEGTCCGAGGGRMWLEERKDQRVNMMRADQILSKSPDVIATSCPYCKIMLGSAINERGAADKVKVLDVMEIVASHIA